MTDELLRFRLLEHDCGNRTWIVGEIDAALPCSVCRGDGLWLERFTFLARDNGPGLAPDPIGLPLAVLTGG